VRAIREALTPRHVPNDIFQVEAVPRETLIKSVFQSCERENLQTIFTTT